MGLVALTDLIDGNLHVAGLVIELPPDVDIRPVGTHGPPRYQTPVGGEGLIVKHAA